MKNSVLSGMVGNSVKSRLQAWLVEIFIKAIKGISKEEDRIEVLVWLSRSRDVLRQAN
jgi:hypothetical protein